MGKKNKNKKKLKTCRWLQLRNPSLKSRICKYSVYYSDGFGPAQNVCKITCKACDKCYENPRSKFVIAMVRDVPKYMTCGRLATKKTVRIEHVCKKEIPNSEYGTPRETCPSTCGVDSCENN